MVIVWGWGTRPKSANGEEDCWYHGRGEIDMGVYVRGGGGAGHRAAVGLRLG